MLKILILINLVLLMPFTLRTQHIEAVFVLTVLLIPFAFNDFRWSEVVATTAVFFTFLHASVAERMQEHQSSNASPDIWSDNWLHKFFLTKEGLWIVFFIMIQSWAALMGAVIFFLYPFWRQWWRKHHVNDDDTPVN